MIPDKDGLYLNNTWVAPSDSIRATYQGNDLTKPDTLESSYTNSFKLPDSRAVRDLTLNAEQLDAANGIAYQTFTAVVINSNEVTFRGFAELTSFNAGWNINLLEEKATLFERLDRSIRTADLSRYNHSWDLDGINKLANASDGACYPTVDCGLLDSGELPLDAIFPACYAHTIVSQMLAEEGYTLAGKLPADKLYKAITLPFVESDPTARDQDFQDDRKARATLDFPNDTFDTNSHRVDRIQPYNIIDRPTDNWTQGKLNNYNPTTFTYTADTEMRVRVEVFQQYKLRVRGGEFEIILTLLKNGQEIARDYKNYDTGHNPFYLNVEKNQLNELVNLKKFDKLTVRLIAQRRTKIGGFDCTILNNPDASWLSITPDLTLTTGDTWQVARNLPDLTGLQLIKAVAFLCEGTYSVDPLRRQIRFISLTDTLNDTANAFDWSDRVDELGDFSWSPKLEPYGQKNYLKWKEASDVTKGYGDGTISINSANLPTEATLFEMPFSAAMPSLQSLPGYGYPVAIPLRSVTRSGATVNISNQSTNPRLLLNYPLAPVAVNTRVFDAEGNATVKTVFLQPCWFGVRPSISITNSTAFCLAFDAVPDARGEATLIKRYYGGLLRVLRRMRVPTLSMNLSPVDIATLDLNKPVRIRRVRVGPIYITDQFFYINKIGPYGAGQITQVVLVCFD